MISNSIRPKPRIGVISPCPPPSGGIAVQAIKIRDKLVSDGFEVTLIPTNMAFPSTLLRLERIKGVRTIARLVALLVAISRQAHKIDVFYFLTGFLNFFMFVTFPVLLLLKLKNKPVILSCHGGWARFFLKRWRLLVKPALTIPKAITAPSGYIASALEELLGMTPQVIPNMIDLEQFSFRKRTTFRPRLIVTRHLDEIYDIPCVIDAFTILLKKYPEAILTIVGDGPRRPSLEERAKSLGIGDRVKFLGAVQHQDMGELYREHDIFVNGSRIDNMPVAMLEAFACGLPVVSTRAGGIPFLVEHMKTGILVDVNDSEALALGVDGLIRRPELARAIAEKAYSTVSEYSWEKISKSLIPLIFSCA